jgi:catechol 2,3-dioxygenase-like lactoylglutathione lyase family enzyme
MKMITVFGLFVLFFSFIEPAVAGENKGAGIVFFNTPRLEEIKEFYIDRIGCQLWIDQGTCAILKYGNLLIGFCSGENTDPEGVITFFYHSREEVDRQYQKFETIAIDTPKENKKYRIYHFYARDPDGRPIEFQHFLHPIDWDFAKFK